MRRRRDNETRMASRRVHDDYLELVKQFPLRPLRTEAEYQDANRLHRSLIGRADVGELSSGQLDYVEALIRFIQDWDHRHYKPSSPLKTPLARLRYLMAQNEMRTTDLGRLVGGRV